MEEHGVLPECLKREQEILARIAEMRNERVDQMGELSARVEGTIGRVRVLEEQVNGDMGLIKVMLEMRDTMQSMRDSLNRQAWLVPLATAAITTAVVALVTKLI